MNKHEVLIKDENDIVIARRKAREIAKFVGFSLTDQTRIITAVSELSRNIYEYAGKGKITIEQENENAKEGLKIVFEDDGPGIKDLALAMKEGYTSGKGMGLGLPGSKRLMDEFEVTSEIGKGTRVIIKKWK